MAVFANTSRHMLNGGLVTIERRTGRHGSSVQLTTSGMAAAKLL